MKQEITAARITELLAERHQAQADTFIAQCKSGPTMTGVRILDGWALRSTWSPWTTVGYEIKVSRSDFEHDQKWIDYLPLCHEFSFVCPPKLIQSTDLPPGIGLIWTTANGTKLVTKRRPTRSEPDHAQLTQLLSYVMMWGRIRGEPTRDERMEEYRRHVEQAAKRGKLAEFVRGHVAEAHQQMAARELQCERREQEAERFRRRLKALGIDWDGSWISTDRAVQTIDRALDARHPGRAARMSIQARDLSAQLRELSTWLAELAPKDVAEPPPGDVGAV